MTGQIRTARRPAVSGPDGAGTTIRRQRSRAQQQAFDLAAGRTLRMQARGDDRGIVAKKRVAGPQIFRQVAKLPMLDPVCRAVDDQQPRLVAPGGRVLGNEPEGRG